MGNLGTTAVMVDVQLDADIHLDSGLAALPPWLMQFLCLRFVRTEIVHMTCASACGQEALLPLPFHPSSKYTAGITVCPDTSLGSPEPWLGRRPHL